MSKVQPKAMIPTSVEVVAIELNVWADKKWSDKHEKTSTAKERVKNTPVSFADHRDESRFTLTNPFLGEFYKALHLLTSDDIRFYINMSGVKLIARLQYQLSNGQIALHEGLLI